jgi:RNA polymerase sigma-70 factor (ECF subfamily)
MFIDLSEFVDRHSSLIARAYELSGAARWALPFDDFACALHVSISASSDAPEVSIGSLRLSDLALAAACRVGIESAWEEFVRRYRPILYSAARAIAGDEFRARELADSLYADLYGMGLSQGRRPLFDHFHGRSSLATWLRAVLAQRHVDYLRESRRAEALTNRAERPEPMAVESTDGERERYLHAIGAAVENALGALAVRDRMRLAYYYRHGLKLREIAHIMSDSESSVSRHLARTRSALRRQIERALVEKHQLNSEQIRVCFGYAAEALPLDLARLLPEER